VSMFGVVMAFNTLLFMVGNANFFS
jgi:hypothetical protein